MDIYERMKAGEWIDIRTDEDYRNIAGVNLFKANDDCWRINNSLPSAPETRKMLEDFFEGRLPQSSTILPPIHIDQPKAMTIGENVFINTGCTMQGQGGIYIGDGVLIGHHATIVTLNHDTNPEKRNDLHPMPVHIGKRVWLGANVTILPGVTIGNGAIIAAGAVVTKDVKENTVVAGVPAKYIRDIELE